MSGRRAQAPAEAGRKPCYKSHRFSAKRGNFCTPMTPGDANVTKRQYEALAGFRYQLRRYLRYSEQITRKHGITPLQYQLLLQVKGYPGRDWATVTELAERMQGKHHGIVALITRCEKRGLLARGVNEEDRRTVRVQLTAKGEGTLRRLAQLHRDELLALRGKFRVPSFKDLE
jgi:DNA-binding MarR family transcriptional regulator